MNANKDKSLTYAILLFVISILLLTFYTFIENSNREAFINDTTISSGFDMDEDHDFYTLNEIN